MTPSNATDKSRFPSDKVIFRKASPIDAEARYPGFSPSTTVLRTGTILKPGHMPLPCDILFERDVAVKLRDGVTIYTDVFRPVEGAPAPAIIAWSPYGKQVGVTLLDKVPDRFTVPLSATSGFEKFEGPDPAYWCLHGYAVVNPDPRGVFMSEGDIHDWGTQEANDCYDLIEWAGRQEWCNGKVGMSGNSWLAMTQWYVAALHPPRLAAIAPWEGVADLYNEDVCWGGIPNPGMNEGVTRGLRGNNRIEDVPAMLEAYPFMNAYWQDKAAKLERIKVPAHIVASWTNVLHTHGTFDGYRRISSTEKWLRVHNTYQWPDYYVPENMEDLRRFFDRYLKGVENGWEATPKVRLSILDPGGTDEVNRPENEFPPARTRYTSLYLDGRTQRLSFTAPAEESVVRYRADDKQGRASFTIAFNEDTEITGYLKLRLWVEADGSDDMDLFVFVRKLDAQGTFLPAFQLNRPDPGARGRLRVSRRRLDPERSTPFEPRLAHTDGELLAPGQIVPVDISILPTSMRWHKGQQLCVMVAGYNADAQPLPGWAEVPESRNRGWHVIHTGRKYDSHLLAPIIPPK
jgi:uncharacterized protein